MTMVARIPRITTTINSSISVNPRSRQDGHDNRAAGEQARPRPPAGRERDLGLQGRLYIFELAGNLIHLLAGTTGAGRAAVLRQCRASGPVSRSRVALAVRCDPSSAAGG